MKNRLAIFFVALLPCFYFNNAVADMLVAHFGGEWQFQQYPPGSLSAIEELDNTDKLLPRYKVRFDCDSNRFTQISDLADLANALVNDVGAEINILTGNQRTKQNQLVKDLVSFGSGGRGVVLAENKCFIIAASVFHNFSSDDESRKAGEPTLMDLKTINEGHNYKRLIGNKTRLGNVLDIISVKKSNFDSRDDSALVVIKKPTCPNNSKQFGPWEKNNIFEFDKFEEYEKKNPKINMTDKGESGVYQLCERGGQFFEKKGPVFRFMVRDEKTSFKQDTMVFNVPAQSGESGCPVVYRDENGTDYFIGLTSALGSKKDKEDFAPGEYRSKKMLATLFTGEIREKYFKLLKATDLEAYLNNR